MAFQKGNTYGSFLKGKKLSEEHKRKIKKKKGWEVKNVVIGCI